MTKYYCDRCKKQIKGANGPYKSVYDSDKEIMEKIDAAPEKYIYEGSISKVTKELSRFPEEECPFYVASKAVMLCENCRTELNAYCMEFMGVKRQ